MHRWQHVCRTNRQYIMAFCAGVSIAVATFWWGETSQTGEISRSALLFIIPVGTGIGLTLGWPQQWRTIWLSVLLMYLLTPFVSGHRIYFGGLIVVHTVATGMLWYLTHQQEARHVAPTHS